MVFLFSLFIIIFIFLICLVLFGKIVIEIDNLKISSMRQKHVNDNYKIIFKLYLFSKIKILKRVFNKQKISNLKINSRMKSIKFNEIIKKEKINTNVIKIFIKDMLEITSINLNIQLGAKDASLTAILVGILSTIISIIFRLKIKNNENQYFNITPIYSNENIINMEINGIFAFKLIHIINIIYILVKEKGEKKNERTSNRKSYEYNYE